MTCDHLRGLHSLEQPRRCALRWVHIGRGDTVDGGSDELDEAVDEFRCNLEKED